MNERKVIDMLKGVEDILKYSDENNLNILYFDLLQLFMESKKN